MTDDALERELRRRAAQLAVPPSRPDRGGTLDVLVFGWDGDRYAVPATHVRRTVRDVAPFAVPGARPPLLGAVAVRSDVVPLIDLRSVLGTAATPRTAADMVVLEEGGRPTLGLAADHLDRLTTWQDAELQRPVEAPPTLRGVFPDGVVLLDADALLDLRPFFSPTEGPGS